MLHSLSKTAHSQTEKKTFLSTFLSTFKCFNWPGMGYQTIKFKGGNNRFSGIFYRLCYTLNFLLNTWNISETWIDSRNWLRHYINTNLPVWSGWQIVGSAKREPLTRNVNYFLNWSGLLLLLFLPFVISVIEIDIEILMKSSGDFCIYCKINAVRLIVDKK